MTKAERRAARRKNLGDYIRILEGRYSESERRGAVKTLQKLLSQIPNEKDDLQAKQEIQKKVQ